MIFLRDPINSCIACCIGEISIPRTRIYLACVSTHLWIVPTKIMFWKILKKKKVGSVKESPPVWDKFQTFVKEFFVCDPSEYVAQFPFLRKRKLQESRKYCYSIDYIALDCIYLWQSVTAVAYFRYCDFTGCEMVLLQKLLIIFLDNLPCAGVRDPIREGILPEFLCLLLFFRQVDLA